MRISDWSSDVFSSDLLCAALGLFGEPRQADAVDECHGTDEQQPEGRGDLEPARAGIALGWRLGKGHGCISAGRSASGTDVAVPGGLAERKAGAPCRLKQTWRVTSSTDSSQAGPARVSKASRSISGPRRRCAAGSGSA